MSGNAAIINGRQDRIHYLLRGAELTQPATYPTYRTLRMYQVRFNIILYGRVDPALRFTGWYVDTLRLTLFIQRAHIINNNKVRAQTRPRGKLHIKYEPPVLLYIA